MSALAGPYTVTRKQRPNADCSCGERVISRWAYATLEEARGVAHRVLMDAGPNAEAWRARMLPESGGAIKLPDGSEIVVEATTYEVLWEQLSLAPRPASVAPGFCQKVLAAWNAEYGTAAQGGHDAA